MHCHLYSYPIDEQMVNEQHPSLNNSFSISDINEHSQELFSKFKDNPQLETVHINCLFEVLQIFGRNPSKMDCHRRIIELEEDEKFELTYEDFLEVLHEPWTSVNNDRNALRKALKQFDRSSEGYINIERFREAMLTLGEPLTDDDVDDLILLGLNEEHKSIDIELLLDELLGKAQ